MTAFHYKNEPLPRPEELLRQLREAAERYDQLEELLALERELAEVEQERGISSPDFHARFLAGDTDDAPETIGWIGRYEAYLRLKQAISDSLQLVLSVAPTTYSD
jgi:hypothetical protein